jgi:ubiquinone biosynthesis protein
MAIPEQFVPSFYKKGVRMKGVVAVLFKHGFFWAAEAMELTRFFPKKLRERVTATDEYQLPVAVRLRRVFEELGPTFVKAGQILSTRPDLIPPDILKELSKLQDEVPPFPFEQVQECIEAELKKPMDQIFQSFARVPIASASIGQVHEAVLLNGQEVVVKVQRPNIEQIVRIDTDIMRDLAVAAEKRFEEARLANLIESVEEFTKTINRELDYTIEAQNAERFKANFADDDTIHIPSIYWDYTTRRVLTMEYIHGIKIKEKDRLLARGYDLTYLTEVIANAYIKMILLDGFFHGDPHFGNIIVMQGQVVGLIDFGMVGVVDPIMKHNMAKYFISLVNKDAEALVEVLSEIAKIDPSADRNALIRDVGRMMQKYSDVTFGQIRLEQLVLELFDIGMKYKIMMPGEFVLMDKTLVTLEGLGRHLDPTFDLVGTAAPAARMLFRREIDPKRIGGDVVRTFLDMRELLTALPRRIDKISKNIEHGHFKVHIELENYVETVRGLVDRVSQSFNRLSLAIIIAALIMALSSLLPLFKDRGNTGRYFLIGLMGFLSLIWAVSAFRSRKH